MTFSEIIKIDRKSTLIILGCAIAHAFCYQSLRQTDIVNGFWWRTLLSIPFFALVFLGVAASVLKLFASLNIKSYPVAIYHTTARTFTLILLFPLAYLHPFFAEYINLIILSLFIFTHLWLLLKTYNPFLRRQEKIKSDFLFYVLLFFLTLIYFFPAMVKKDYVLGPSSLYYAYYPWKADYQKYRPDLMQYHTMAGDVIDGHLLGYHFTSQLTRRGKLPTWSPSLRSGTPLTLSSFCLFSIISLLQVPLNFIFPFYIANTLAIFLMSFGAGFFLFKSARILKLSATAGLFCALAFMFNTYNTIWLQSYFFNGFCLLPLLFYLCESFLQTREKKRLFFLSLTVALMLLCGYVHVGVYSSYFMVAYIILRVFSTAGINYFSARKITAQGGAVSWLTCIKPPFYSGLWLALAFLLGIGLSLIQMLPNLEFFQSYVDLSYRQRNYPHIIPLNGLFNMFFYGHLGDFFHTKYRGMFNAYETSINYFGFLTALFACTSIIVSVVRKQATGIILSILFMLTFCIVYGFDPVIGIWWKFPFINSMSSTYRFSILLNFFGPLAAMFSLDYWLTQLTRRRANARHFPTPWLNGLAIALPIIALAIFYHFNSTEQHFYYTKALAGTLLVTLLAASWFYVRNYITLVILSTVMVMLSFSDMLFNTYRHVQKSPDRTFHPRTPGIAYLEKNMAAFDRMLPINVFGNLQAYYFLKSPTGHEFYPQPFKQVFKLIHPDPYATITWPRVPVKGTNYYSPALDLFGIRYVVFPPRTNPQLLPQSQYKTVYDGNDLLILERTHRHTPVGITFNRQFKFWDQESSPLPAWKNKDFSIYQTTFLAASDKSKLAPGLLAAANMNIAPPTSKIVVLAYTDDAINLTVDTTTSGVLSLPEIYYPGWVASVNGKETPVLKTNLLFRGVSLPAGKNDVLFRFRPTKLYQGALFSLFSLALAGILFLRGNQQTDPIPTT